MSRVAPTTARSQDNPSGLRSNGRTLSLATNLVLVWALTNV